MVEKLEDFFRPKTSFDINLLYVEVIVIRPTYTVWEKLNLFWAIPLVVLDNIF